jgi:4,5-DOPA dioxygenase extradiol
MISFPVIFIGHGSPMNALEDNEFSREWAKLGSSLPRPRSIVCISSHWTAMDTYVTATDEPRTIHDFLGFPDALNQIQYPAPGDPLLAGEIVRLSQQNVKMDYRWGLDHGCWSVLRQMYPEADIPVVQLSLNMSLSPGEHFELAHQLKFIREQNVLVIGSGNIVHNLGTVSASGEPYPWALRFDQMIKEKVLTRDLLTLFNYKKLGEDAQLSVPSPEHFLPLFYVLGMANLESEINFFCEKILMGSISMTSFIVRD